MEYEKRDEPVTFRTSCRKATWLNDVARAHRIDRSLLCDEVMTDFLENQERVRTPDYRTRELSKRLQAAKTAVDAACAQMAAVLMRGEQACRRSA